jgi:putative SOS response-associated peptidase YedK
MCGRIGLKDPPRDVGKWLDARVSDELETTWEARYNVGPTDPILGAQVDRDGDRVLQYRWGLIPSWAKDPKVGLRSFNARADSVATKPLFRNAFQRRRLLVPVSGFYEWQAVPDRKAKQPHWFTRADEEPVVFAGLWEWWRSPEGEEIYSATIITTDAGPDMEQIHHRQPVVLESETWERWLDPAVDADEELEGMLRPGPAGVLRHWPVGQSVGNVRNQGRQLIDAVNSQRG